MSTSNLPWSLFLSSFFFLLFLLNLCPCSVSSALTPWGPKGNEWQGDASWKLDSTKPTPRHIRLLSKWSPIFASRLPTRVHRPTSPLAGVGKRRGQTCLLCVKCPSIFRRGSSSKPSGHGWRSVPHMTLRPIGIAILLRKRVLRGARSEGF